MNLFCICVSLCGCIFSTLKTRFHYCKAIISHSPGRDIPFSFEFHGSMVMGDLEGHFIDVCMC